MGLKKSNWINPNTGDKMRSAYAMVDVIETDGESACVRFKISKNRDLAISNPSIFRNIVVPEINKSGILYEEIYNYAKQNDFEGWSDDIVSENETVESDEASNN